MSNRMKVKKTYKLTCRSGNLTSLWTGRGMCISLCRSGNINSEKRRSDKRRSGKRRSANRTDRWRSNKRSRDCFRIHWLNSHTKQCIGSENNKFQLLSQSYQSGQQIHSKEVEASKSAKDPWSNHVRAVYKLGPQLTRIELVQSKMRSDRHAQKKLPKYHRYQSNNWLRPNWFIYLLKINE